jgi:GH15 family glucan-1,4-alpha-glucosidase
MAIADHAMIGDQGTAALIDRTGKLSWLCWPDFDSQACFASLLGSDGNGCWALSPKSPCKTERRYLDGTLVLETTHTHWLSGAVSVTDFMPTRNGHSSVVRIVRGLRGRVRMTTNFAPRFDYGSAQPRVEPQAENCWCAVSGPHRIVLRSDVPLQLENGDLRAELIVKQGDCNTVVLQHSNSYQEPAPAALDAEAALHETTQSWRDWIKPHTYNGPYRQALERSLLTLKALTYAPSGGFVAAPTCSLPEKVGGIRNWDYRFCWLRDTTFSLLGLLQCGYQKEAQAWLHWLSRSVQGNPSALKIMYGITGKREHSEWEASWLTGYRNSRPVHIGNKASDQLQLDTFGEVLDALYRARCAGLYPLDDRNGEALEIPLLEHLEHVWQDPDAGLWEMRSGNDFFTQSRVMAWVAFDRGIRMVEQFDVKGPVERWRKLRSEIHADVCRRGFHKRLHSFTQRYGGTELDASLLLLPLVGFLPIEDPRIEGTVQAVRRRLTRDGLLIRYDTAKVVDGLPAGEGAFIACNFWLVDVLVLQGKHQEARALFEKLLSLSNDVGLLSEEYSAKHGLIGNFPQAFSHIGIIHAALSLHLGTSVQLLDLSQDRAT